MGIFSKIKNAIFGNDDAAAAPTEAPATAPAGTVVSNRPPPTVDIEQVLAAKAAESGRDLDWRNSIVDLMKLVGIDSSLDNRKALARELGYDGALDGSAEMNIWLHKATMAELAKHGGRVPAAMLD